MLEIVEPPLEAGLVVLARYRLSHVLGQGGMGVVWAARDLAQEVDVALKFLRPKAGDSASSRARLLREGAVGASLQSPHIARVYAARETEVGSVFLVMDLLHGESLRAHLRRTRMGLEQACACVAEVAAGVAAAHAQGVIHRDLKPENVFVTASGMKVMDFGIAKIEKLADTDPTLASLTQTGAMVGTPYYMAPEQVYGDVDVDVRADIWSLGILAYECLSGLRPTSAEGLGQIIKKITQDAIPRVDTVNRNVPPDLAALVAQMLSRARELRPTAIEVADAFRAHTLGFLPGTWAATELGAPARLAFPVLSQMRVGNQEPTQEEPAPISVARTQDEPPRLLVPTDTPVLPARARIISLRAFAALAAVTALGSAAVTLALARRKPQLTAPPLPGASVAPALTAAAPSQAFASAPASAPQTQGGPTMDHFESARRAMMDRNGALCMSELAEFDKLNPTMRSTDVRSWAAHSRAQCLMLIGECSAGRALYEHALEAQNPGHATPAVTTQSADYLVARFCVGDALAPRDAVVRSSIYLSNGAMGQSPVDRAGCMKHAAIVLEFLPRVPAAELGDSLISARERIRNDAPQCLAKARACPEAVRLYEQENKTKFDAVALAQMAAAVLAPCPVPSK